MICIATKGLRGSDIGGLPQTEEELAEHMERVHHMIVIRKGETLEQATERCDRLYPERLRCAECQEARGEVLT